MNKTLVLALVFFATSAGVHAKPVQVFILAGQSNMDGQANVKTIDFLGEDKAPSRAALLKTFKPDGKTFVTRKDVWVVNGGVHDILQTGFGGRKNYDQLGTNIGPEYAFGYYMGAALDEHNPSVVFLASPEELSAIYSTMAQFTARYLER